MSQHQTERIEGLLKSFGNEEQLKAWRDRREKQTASAVEPPKDTATEEPTKTADKLDEQTELLRAILASTVDTQEDARATAQNSRTFAWAGTAIALLTLIATVISIVAAIRAN
jgi:hypothetical protein